VECRDLTASHNGELHGHQQWVPAGHHKKPGQRNHSHWQRCPSRRQIAGHLSEARENPEAPGTRYSSSHRQHHFGKKDEGGKSLPFNGQVKRFFCLSVIRMRPERKILSEIEGKVGEFTTEISPHHREY